MTMFTLSSKSRDWISEFMGSLIAWSMLTTLVIGVLFVLAALCAVALCARVFQLVTGKEIEKLDSPVWLP